ncbi:hypothetical protein ACLF3G_28295 [Falsiroseomonas sp. HC035]|uniref:hypothetical protein n=1 Tax=Falsiroseomonas sp. HC035 TaxID=3390999 RepID=UPI003D31063E
MPTPFAEIAFLNLPPDQQQAACACGITFVPATIIQVQRLTMQRRVFRIGEQPFLATRSAGFYETYGTLLLLVDEYERDRQRRPDDVLVPSGEAAPMTPSDIALQGPATLKAGPASTASDQQQQVTKATPKRLRPARAGAKPTPDASSTAVANEAPGQGDVVGAEELPPPSQIAGVMIPDLVDEEPLRTVRRPRIRQPQPPRWTTAGKARRGRLK